MPESNLPQLPASSTGKFLKDDGTWDEAGGGSFSGDMDDIPNGATYVKTENNYTDADAAKVANLSGTNTGDQDISGIATNAAAISALDSGKLDVPTGTPDGTKYLRDDNTWQPVSGGSGLAQYQVRRILRR